MEKFSVIHLISFCLSATITSKCICIWKHLTLSLIETVSDASVADEFWKLCNKRRNCSKQCVQLYSISMSSFRVIFHIIVEMYSNCLLQIWCMWEMVQKVAIKSIKFYVMKNIFRADDWIYYIRETVNLIFS